MGAHPNGCSRKAETHELLSDVINQNKVQSLGNYTKERFGELPFLFKVLAAEMPLSVCSGQLKILLNIYSLYALQMPRELTPFPLKYCLIDQRKCSIQD